MGLRESMSIYQAELQTHNEAAEADGDLLHD